MFGIELPPDSQALHVYAQTLCHAAKQLQKGGKENSYIYPSISPLGLVKKQSCTSHLFLHVIRTVRRGSGQKGRQVGVQRVLRLGSEREHLDSRVQTPQLLLQTAHKHCHTPIFILPKNYTTLDYSCDRGNIHQSFIGLSKLWGLTQSLSSSHSRMFSVYNIMASCVV